MRRILPGPTAALHDFRNTGRGYWASRILRVIPEKELRWRGKLWLDGLFDGEHYFQLTPENGGTRLVHGEHFSGWLVPLVRGWLRGDITDNFQRLNVALVQRLDQLGHHS